VHLRTPQTLATHLDLMAAAGFTLIRVGESVWSTWEPREGHFELDWLEPVLDAAHERGIGAVVGTPTYAVPPWLRRRYPWTAARRRNGFPIPYGHRQDTDITDPTFRGLAARVVGRIVSRYAGHPAVRGWQVDNEPGNELLHNPGVFAEFGRRLRNTYGDVAALNEAWGLAYWSHRLADWADLWPPDGNTVPAYDLAWRRFQADLTTEYIAWQVEIVRAGARPDQFVTTCLSVGRPAVAPAAVAATGDLTAVNVYTPMQDALTLPQPPEHPVGGRPEWLDTFGLWPLYQQADTAYGLRGGPFLVTETAAGSIGESHVNHPAFDGQWRQAAWALVARGARLVGYWHWHTLHSGHEAYWGGVLGHSLEPGRCYRELARTGAELRAAADDLRGLVPDVDAAILSSVDSRWAMQFQPPLARAGGDPAPDPGSYDRIIGGFYRGLFEAGGQLAVVPEVPGPEVPVLVVPGLYVADDELLHTLLRYAEDGGHLVVGIRTGYADEQARPRPALMPGVLAKAAGVHYDEYTNLAAPVPVVASAELDPGEPVAATAWADALEVDSATVLASYDHPHLGRWPAITTNTYGRGRVTYVGTLPDPALARTLGRWLLARPPAVPGEDWSHRPPSVTLTTATNAAAQRLRFVANWSWDPVTLTVPASLRCVTSGERLRPGDRITLGAWDVRVLIDDELPRKEDSPS
jgi:beta-galactosidase